MGEGGVLDGGGEKVDSPTCRHPRSGTKKFRREEGMGVRGKGRREALFC
jgi:hypothetical protein